MLQSLLESSLQHELVSPLKALSEAFVRAGARYKNMVILDGNSSKFLNTGSFAQIFPDRHFNFGNAEQNMISAACGFTVRGKIPVVCTSAMMASGRAWEQIRNDICYPHLNVKIIGAYPGIGGGEGGATTQALEDLAIMRVIPNMKVLCPADAIETKKMFEAMMNDYGPTYLRLHVQALPTLYDHDYRFEIGRGSIYKSGTDVCIFAMGMTVHTALEAAGLLERDGVSTMVVNISSLNPIDENLIVECVKQAHRVVTVEDHQLKGGLGSVVTEVLATHYPSKILRIGMDGFGESGKAEDLYRKYGLDGVGIYERITDYEL